MAAAQVQRCKEEAKEKFKQDIENSSLPNLDVGDGVSLKQEIRMFLLGDRGDMPDTPQTAKTMKAMIAAEIFDIRDANGANVEDEEQLDIRLKQRIDVNDDVWAQLSTIYNNFANEYENCNQAGGKRKKTRKHKKHHKKTRKQKKQRKSKKSY